MIKHFLSHRKGNTSVKQQEIKHFMVQCPNFMLKIYVQLPKVLLYNKQPFQSIKRGNCQWPLQGRACPPLFLDQTEAQRAKKTLFWDCPPPPPPPPPPAAEKKAFFGLAPPPPPYLRVWMTRPSSLSEGLDPSLVVWVSVDKFLQKVPSFCIGEYSLLQRVFSIPSIWCIC